MLGMIHRHFMTGMMGSMTAYFTFRGVADGLHLYRYPVRKGEYDAVQGARTALPEKVNDLFLARLSARNKLTPAVRGAEGPLHDAWVQLGNDSFTLAEARAVVGNLSPTRSWGETMGHLAVAALALTSAVCINQLWTPPLA